jgi:hypothetical protein
MCEAIVCFFLYVSLKVKISWQSTYVITSFSLFQNAKIILKDPTYDT